MADVRTFEPPTAPGDHNGPFEAYPKGGHGDGHQSCGSSKTMARGKDDSLASPPGTPLALYSLSRRLPVQESNRRENILSARTLNVSNSRRTTVKGDKYLLFAARFEEALR